MITFEKVSSGEVLLEWWPRIREALVDNVQYHGEITAPERVHQAIVSGAADLYLIFDEEEYLGPVVLTIEGVGQRLAPYLYVWQLHAPALIRTGRFPQFMDWLDRLAGERGLTRIRMNTTRKGWERAIGQFAEPVLVEYERKVPHG